jgi:hypothetical protein
MTTCQICAREIQAKSGRIAHHGYRRPGHGWQTASCFGAKYRPYEVACDAIAAGIAACERFIARNDERVADLFAAPPADYVEKNAWGVVKRTVIRPEGFDPHLVRHTFGEDSRYAFRFHEQINTLRRQQVAARADIAFMNERLAAWKPATDKEAV